MADPRSFARSWLHAFRLRTLPLALGSIIVGSALAEFHGAFKWPVFLLASLTALLLQVLSNLANDLGDHQHGTDNPDRIGPQRAVQSGAIPPAAMKRGMLVCGVLSFTSGMALITVAFGFSVTTLVFLLIGLVAIAAAVKYTYGRNPYGYAGLGDVSVLVFFGLVGVGGTFYLHSGSFSTSIILPAVGFGSLATGVLNTNNMRDIVNDGASGKRTVAVRLGAMKARRYHYVLILLAGACIVGFTVFNFRSWWQYAFIPGAFLIDRHLREVMRNRDPGALDPELRRLALGTFFTALTFSLGLILA